jgi:hypothetical protein
MGPSFACSSAPLRGGVLSASFNAAARSDTTASISAAARRLNPDGGLLAGARGDACAAAAPNSLRPTPRPSRAHKKPTHSASSPPASPSPRIQSTLASARSTAPATPRSTSPGLASPAPGQGTVTDPADKAAICGAMAAAGGRHASSNAGPYGTTSHETSSSSSSPSPLPPASLCAAAASSAVQSAGTRKDHASAGCASPPPPPRAPAGVAAGVVSPSASPATRTGTAVPNSPMIHSTPRTSAAAGGRWDSGGDSKRPPGGVGTAETRATPSRRCCTSSDCPLAPRAVSWLAADPPATENTTTSRATTKRGCGGAHRSTTTVQAAAPPGRRGSWAIARVEGDRNVEADCEHDESGNEWD